MKQSFVVNAELRTDQGKGASRRLRRTGKVPAIIYGGKDAPQQLALDHNEMRNVVSAVGETLKEMGVKQVAPAAPRAVSSD